MGKKTKLKVGRKYGYVATDDKGQLAVSIPPDAAAVLDIVARQLSGFVNEMAVKVAIDRSGVAEDSPVTVTVADAQKVATYGDKLIDLVSTLLDEETK